MRRAVVRRALGLGVLASAGVSAVMMAGVRPAVAQAPDAAGWWNAANVGDPAPAPPPPPDVKDGDLFVQGSNAGPSGTPLGAAPSSSQAIAALGFDLQPTDLVGNLTLPIDGSPPPQVSVVACRATDRFTDTDNGQWSQAPAYDGKACVPGKLKGSAVVFASLGTLVSDARLAVVILPGSLDRIVFKHPTAGALAVQHGTGVGAAAPPVGAGTGSGGAPGATGAPAGGTGSGGSTAAVGGSAVTGPTTGNTLPGAATTTGGSDTAPVVAPPSRSGGAPVSARPVAASSGLSTGARRGIALGVIALEVLGYLLLMRAPAPDTAPVAAGESTGRIRPPDRGLAGGRAAQQSGGVGRFRRERQGPAPQL